MATFARKLTGLMLLAAAGLPTTTLHAQSGPAPSPGEPGLFDPSRTTLLGDMGGVRSLLGKYGITLGLQTTAEGFANAAGGIRRGASGDGVTQLGLGLDTKKAFGWEGGTFNVSLLWLYGPDFSQNYLGVQQASSGIVGAPTVRLWELWYQQAFLGGRMDVKIGQQSVDQEFMTSEGSNLFLNEAMGWPITASANLYAGGPADPLSSLGVRLRGQPSDAITLLGGVVQDNPPGGPFDDDGQLRGSTRWGGNFNLRTGALFIAEAQFAINQPAEGAAAGSARRGLPGTYKVGAWFDTARFPDQRFDNTGLSLADPNGTGIARTHRHNYSLYAVADQTVWQEPGGPRSISAFARPMVAPTNQNLIDFSINAGATLKAPLPSRDDDTFGVGVGVANVSSRARGLDQDTAFFSGAYTPLRGAETFLEITYQAQLAPWWQVQPDFQYFWMPGGGVANPRDATTRIGNAAVFAIRSSITF